MPSLYWFIGKVEHSRPLPQVIWSINTEDIISATKGTTENIINTYRLICCTKWSILKAQSSPLSKPLSSLSSAPKCSVSSVIPRPKNDLAPSLVTQRLYCSPERRRVHRHGNNRTELPRKVMKKTQRSGYKVLLISAVCMQTSHQGWKKLPHEGIGVTDWDVIGSIGTELDRWRWAFKYSCGSSSDCTGGKEAGLTLRPSNSRPLTRIDRRKRRFMSGGFLPGNSGRCLQPRVQQVTSNQHGSYQHEQ